jgi:hypothetical protein
MYVKNTPAKMELPFKPVIDRTNGSGASSLGGYAWKPDMEPVYFSIQI